MKINLPNPIKDERGLIQDLVIHNNITSCTLVTFNSGAVRGNHYHEKTLQWNYLIKGEVYYSYGEVNLSQIHKNIYKAGDLFFTDIYKAHAIKAIKDSTLLVLTSGPRSGSDYENDTIRLNQNLFDI